MHKITFRIVHHPWSAVVLMFHELGVDAPTLLDSLREGHGIEIDPNEDPEIYFVLDSEMRDKLHASNFRDPTEGQLCGTSRCVGLSEQDAREKFTAQFLCDN